MSLAVDSMTACITGTTGSACVGAGVYDVIQSSSVRQLHSSMLYRLPTLNLTEPPPLRQRLLSCLFASCLDFLAKDDVAAADALLMRSFDVCISGGSGGGGGGSSSSSRVAIIDSMRARCCSPCVSLCPHIQVSA
jgi:hypothetical protein